MGVLQYVDVKRAALATRGWGGSCVAAWSKRGGVSAARSARPSSAANGSALPLGEAGGSGVRALSSGLARKMAGGDRVAWSRGADGTADLLGWRAGARAAGSRAPVLARLCSSTSQPSGSKQESVQKGVETELDSLKDFLGDAPGGSAGKVSTESPPPPENVMEPHSFQADVARVMDIIIHSLYSQPEVFLRELVSNASDAMDKRRLLALQSDSKVTMPQLDKGEAFEVKVFADKIKKQLIIEDAGVGMTKEELLETLGSIATSGTKKFAEALKQSKGVGDQSALIGQFGVGFYSSFLVADKVSVVTRSAMENGEQYIWESVRGEGYSVGLDKAKPFGELTAPGSKVVLHLKDDQKQFLELSVLKNLLKKYSEFVPAPIKLAVRLDETEADPAWQHVNAQPPIWLRSPKDVTASEYTDFYRKVTGLNDVPLSKAHFTAEGDISFKSVLFVPSVMPKYLRGDQGGDGKPRISLYVKRVFITNDLKSTLPDWTHFVCGVVDSDDLPLNVSREMLQKSKALRTIGNQIVRKALSMLTALANDEKDPIPYETFWRTMGGLIQVGVTQEEGKVQRQLMGLLRFWTTIDDGERLVGLEEYVRRMPAEQKEIYYVIGSSQDQARNSPYLKKVLNKGFPVIYATDSVEQLMLARIGDYVTSARGKGSESLVFTEVGAEIAGESGADDESKKRLSKKFAPLSEYVAQLLGSNKVSTVEVTNALAESGVLLAIAPSPFGFSPAMEQYMFMQQRMESGPTGEHSGSTTPPALPKAVQINAAHPAATTLLQMAMSDEQKHAEELESLVHVLYHAALVRSGYAVYDPTAFVTGIDNLVTSQMWQIQEDRTLPPVPEMADLSMPEEFDQDDGEYPMKKSEDTEGGGSSFDAKLQADARALADDEEAEGGDDRDFKGSAKDPLEDIDFSTVGEVGDSQRQYEGKAASPRSDYERSEYSDSDTEMKAGKTVEEILEEERLKKQNMSYTKPSYKQDPLLDENSPEFKAKEEEMRRFLKQEQERGLTPDDPDLQNIDPAEWNRPASSSSDDDNIDYCKKDTVDQPFRDAGGDEDGGEEEDMFRDPDDAKAGRRGDQGADEDVETSGPEDEPQDTAEKMEVEKEPEDMASKLGEEKSEWDDDTWVEDDGTEGRLDGKPVDKKKDESGGTKKRKHDGDLDSPD
ncbi:Heat shock protein HSP 90-alpha [Porphyridium purpureum]|uniref:Heat shock protein HSP 90-alpha n=1 Tax=Porphyridium purpureum TaxID=35688 RepID=A0A5J4YVT0_PORPP|nr:Heat shock protein HSP 90-alpha [Porphyridium purpureum]|eukprot:POR3468..scf227_4